MPRFTTQGTVGQQSGAYLVDGSSAILAADYGSCAALAATLNQLATLGNRRARLVATANVASLSGLSAIDGVTPSAGDPVLLVGQSTPSQNGLWIASAGAWSLDSDWTTGQVVSGMVVTVGEGTAWASSEWKVTTTGAITVGSTALAFFPRVVKGVQALTAGAATVSSLYVLSTSSGLSLVDQTSAAAVKGVLVAGAGSGSLTLTGTGTDSILYSVINF